MFCYFNNHSSKAKPELFIWFNYKIFKKAGSKFLMLEMEIVMSVNITEQNFNPVRRTIKKNNIFLVTDSRGNIVSDNCSGYGLYTDDTRFLSKFTLKLNDTEPIILSASTESGHSSIIIGTNITMPNVLYEKKEDEKEKNQNLQAKKNVV